MPCPERRGRLIDCCLHQRLGCCLHVDIVDKAGQPRLQIVGIGRRQIGPIERCLLLGRRRYAKHFLFGGRKRDHNQIVLICAKGRLTFGDEQTDDLQWHALDLDEGADRILAGTEQLAIDRLADDDDQRRFAFVFRADAASRGNLPVGDRADNSRSRLGCSWSSSGCRTALGLAAESYSRPVPPRHRRGVLRARPSQSKYWHCRNQRGYRPS